MKYFAIECAPKSQKPFEYNLRLGGYISFDRALRKVIKKGNGFVMDQHRQIITIVRGGIITHDLRNKCSVSA